MKQTRQSGETPPKAAEGVGPRQQARGMRETPVRCTATAVALRVAARLRGACFEASYQPNWALPILLD
eukprot:6172082-Pleurochrysis_carterae.AAC.2